MDSYPAWYASLGDTGLANDDPVPSSCELQDDYSVEVLDTYGKLNPSFDYQISSLLLSLL